MDNKRSLVFVYSTYIRMDIDLFLQHSIRSFENIEFLDIRNLFPTCMSASFHKFADEKLPKKTIKFETIQDFEQFLENTDHVYVFGIKGIANCWKLYHLFAKYNSIIIGSYLKVHFNSKAIESKNYFNILYSKVTFLIYRYLTQKGYFPEYDKFFTFPEMKTRLQYAPQYKDFITVNTDVYDTYLSSNDEIKSENIVFLDFNLPFLADFINVDSIPPNPEEYYKNLDRIFSIVEQKYDKEVVICAHPKFKMENSKQYFFHRKVVQYQTNEYINSASLLISHSSSVLNYAIIRKKPVILLDSDTFPLFVKNSLNVYISELDVISIDMYKTKQCEIIDILQNKILVNHEKYEKYILKYLKGNESNLTSPEIMIDSIKKEYGIN